MNTDTNLDPYLHDKTGTWPPPKWAPIYKQMNTWASWWNGTPKTNTVNRFNNRETQGNRPSRPDLHIPIAADLARTSADLLYSTPPIIATEDKDTPTDEAITTYQDLGLLDELLSGAEVGATMGGRFHRVTIDPAVSNRPFLTTIDPNCVIPTFTWGRLTAATCWTVIAQENTVTWRHVEHHHLDSQGNGLIEHALYEGTPTHIGHRVPLTDRPETTPLAETVNEQAQANQPLTPGLFITYYPNLTPQRRWRALPHATHLGRSDLDGLDGLMDALDETYSSWMRDLRLGKARVLIAKDLLEQDAHGQPVFDLDQEIFTPLDGLIPAKADQLALQPVQFQIRVTEHLATIQELTAQIVRAAGYSQATFAEHDNDTDVTATEIKAREKRTLTTRDRKIRLETRALTETIHKMLTIDHELNPGENLDPDSIKITFPPLAQESIANLSQTAATLKNASLTSLQTALELLHPEWDAQQVSEETARIQRENQTIIDPEQWRPRTGKTLTIQPETSESSEQE